MQSRGKKRIAALFFFLTIFTGVAYATDVYISEFMASNSSTLTNEFDETEDWIELYNDSSSSINLSGWHLTDNPTDLSKWEFPSVTLPSKGYLIVWASNRDTVENGEIHTNFKLDGDGEYLALVRPDGTTVEHEFSPKYADQKTDVSYGLIFDTNGSEITLSDSQVACKYLVPSSDIGTSWHDLVFDDSAWLDGLTPVGYDHGSTPIFDEEYNTDVSALMRGKMASIYLRIPFVVADPAALSDFMISMRYEDGFAAYLDGVDIASDNLPTDATALTLAWDAAAGSGRNESLAATMMPIFSSSLPQDYLVAGTNVLVIHGLNASTTSSDLLMQTVITGNLSDGYVTFEKAYFATPTPGALNSGSAVGFVADTSFSVDRGFFTNAFEVAISTATDGADIRYTLDGSTPSEVDGTIYTNPIRVSATTVLRAIAYKTGWEASDVDTQTYIFPAEVIQQPEQPAGWPTLWSGGYKDYEMDPDIVDSPDYVAEFPSVLLRIPTLSIVTDQDNLFGSSGIYDNSTREGVAWERPASAELIHPDGSKGFQVNCGLRMQGGASRGTEASAKHSFRLLFKDIYGPSKLNYELFDDSPVDSFDTIILRAGYNNSWIHRTAGQRNSAQYTRDQFVRRAQAAMGQTASHGTYVHLYVNGLYWGVYNPSERPEATFASDHMGGDKDEWDATNSATFPFTDGDMVAWNTMVDIATNGLADLADYEAFMEYCDVENLADFMIINHFAGNGDWDHHNWYGARRRRDGAGYKFFCWDAENSLNSLTANTTGKDNEGKPSDLFQNARANEEFRLLFADRLHKHFFNTGVLTPANTSNLWKTVSDTVDGVAVAESARWGDWRLPDAPYTVNDHYLVEQERIRSTIFPDRAAVVLDQYKSMGLYPDLAAPKLSEHGGLFTNSTSISMSGPTYIYYTIDGNDPREFGTGAIIGTLYSGRVVLDNTVRVKARCYDGVTWSALSEADFYDASPSPLQITEIMHSPRLPNSSEASVNSDASAYKFVELYNSGAETIGLPGVVFADGIRFDFSTSDLFTLAPGAYAVVVQDRPAFLARYPGLESKIAGEFLDKLSGSGDSLKVKAEGQGSIISFTYKTSREWPLAADGAGHSLVALTAENLSHGGNWRASQLVDGSPGAVDDGATISQLCLNEITGHTDLSDPAYPDYDSNDWIELFNAGTTTVSLADYYLSDDPYDLLKWPIPAGLNLAPGAFMAFDEITGFHSPITSGFGINKAGEQILLSYAPGGALQSVVDTHSFKGQENGVSIGRYPDGSAYWVQTVPTLGTENVLAGQNVVISEVMYHPLEEGGTNENTNLEFIELFNPTASDVPLWVMEDAETLGSWRIKGDVDYTFPSNTTLSAEQRVLVVPFDPLDSVLSPEFTTYYNLAAGVPMFGPFDGKLSNQGGRITLEKPQAPDAFDETISWVIIDELFFSEAEPWMPSADGMGYALHRVSVDAAAADPGSWKDAMPSPGTASILQPDLWIIYFGAAGNQALFDFQLLPDTKYMLEYSTNLQDNIWMPGVTLENQTNYIAPISSDTHSLYYRLKRN